MSFSDHLQQHFPERSTAFIAPARDGVEEQLPGFRVLRIAPAKTGEPWVYATCGAAQSAAAGEDGAEYVLLSPAEDPALAELLATLATFNAAADESFGVGSIIAIGRPWLARSWARHLLVLPPYPFDPGFEVCADGDRSTFVLWLVPILSAEAQYVREHGHQALEQIIEKRKTNVADPARTSVV